MRRVIGVAMGRSRIAELKEGDTVDGVYALRAKELRAARTGEAYLSLELGDRTGRIAGVMFRPPLAAQEVPAGAVVSVRGVATSFRGTLRVSAETLRPAAAYDVADLLPTGRRDTDELISELGVLIRGVRNRPLRRVLRSIYSDSAFLEAFKRCPAATSHHHAYIGGLLEHTVAVATLCRQLASAHPELDADLLVAGAILHDIGKVDELRYDTAIDYTDEGRLLGHVVLSERRVRQAMEALGEVVSPEVALRLSHVVLAHHGELEWGSPKRPSTLEALALHHVDNLDAKTSGFIEALASAARVDEAWTDSANLFRRPLYAPRAAEDERWYRPQEDDQFVRIA